MPHLISIIGGYFITSGSTYHGELSPYSVTVHTKTTKRTYIRSHPNFSSSTLYANPPPPPPAYLPLILDKSAKRA